MLYIVTACLLLLGAWMLFSRMRGWARQLIALCFALLVLSPWFIRNHEITGVYVLSGAGWRDEERVKIRKGDELACSNPDTAFESGAD
jgi:hypothetical protein